VDIRRRFATRAFCPQDFHIFPPLSAQAFASRGHASAAAPGHLPTVDGQAYYYYYF